MTKNKLFLYIILTFSIVAAVLAGFFLLKSNFFGSANQQDRVAVKVDAAASLGEMPFLFRTGIWLQDNPNYKYVLSKFTADNAVGKIQIEIGNELAGSKSFADFKEATKKRYAPGTVFRYGIDEAKKTGQTLIIGQWPGKMPQWLSSRAGDSRVYSDSGFKIGPFSPPKCYKEKCYQPKEMTCYNDECKTETAAQLEADGSVVGWRGVVDYTIKFFRDELGIKNLGYYFGHEQNKDWLGSEEEFYKTYEATAKAVKGVDPSIPLGGAGPWYYAASRLKCQPADFNQLGMDICATIPGWSMDNFKKPLNQNFLEYAEAHDLPVDFLNYHMFGEIPTAASQEQMAGTMRGWLAAAGFSEQTPLYPADWTIWSGNYPADYIDTEYNAAYVVNSLYYMDKAGIAWHSHDFNVRSGVLEKPAGKNAQFSGDWPIFTVSDIIKPVYNSFRAVSLVYGKAEGKAANRLKTEFNDEFLTAVSSLTGDKKTARVLLANFSPAGKKPRDFLMPELKKCMVERNYTEDQYGQIMQALKKTDKAGLNEEGLGGGVISKIIDTAEFTAPLDAEAVKKDLSDCASSLKALSDRWESAAVTRREIAVGIDNLPFSGKAILTVYRVDREHANSCRYNKRTEEKKTATECGVNGAIDKMAEQAKNEARKESLKTAQQYLKGLGYSDKEILQIKSQLVEPCLGEDVPATCFNGRIEKACEKFPEKNCNKAKQDLTEAYARAKQVGDDLFYYGRSGDLRASIWIDKINNDPNVSLEGSKETTEINIIEGRYEGTITLDPYALALIEISKK